MCVQDIKQGMKISIAFGDAGGKKDEYLGEVVDCIDKDIFVTLDSKSGQAVDKRDRNAFCRLNIVVDNVLYCWEHVAVQYSRHGDRYLTEENIRVCRWITDVQSVSADRIQLMTARWSISVPMVSHFQ